MEVIPISRLHIILYFYNSQCQINSLQEREEVESTTADHQKDNETPEVSLKAAPRHNPHHILAQLISFTAPTNRRQFPAPTTYPLLSPSIRCQQCFHARTSTNLQLAETLVIYLNHFVNPHSMAYSHSMVIVIFNCIISYLP